MSSVSSSRPAALLISAVRTLTRAKRMHQSIPEQGKWLKQVITGYLNYHAVQTNWAALGAFRAEITDRWRPDT